METYKTSDRSVALGGQRKSIKKFCNVTQSIREDDQQEVRSSYCYIGEPKLKLTQDFYFIS